MSNASHPLPPQGLPCLHDTAWPTCGLHDEGGLDRAHQQDLQQGGARSVRTEPILEGAHAGYTYDGSPSSLAMALNDSVMQPERHDAQSSVPQEQMSRMMSSPVSATMEYGQPYTIEAFYSGAQEVQTAAYTFGMYFPETLYEEQPPTSFDKHQFMSFSECDVSSPPSHVGTTYSHDLTLDAGIIGQEYGPSSPFSPILTHSYGYAIDSPVEIDDSIVIPSPPTAAQISRSSTLANAMKLPPTLQTPPPLPTPTPAPAAPTPELDQAEAVPQENHAGATPVATQLTPASSTGNAPKKRPSKTGRPRGRPPKHPLTFLPRHKIVQPGEISATTAAVSAPPMAAASNPPPDAPTPDMIGPDGVPGQSSFMLDNAMPEPPKKKPIMACLFCRERKIACGPPPAEHEDQTCKQCLRRDLICEWPTESKRGQHKRVPKVTIDGGSDASRSSKGKARVKVKQEDTESHGAEDDGNSQTAPKPQRSKLTAAQRKRIGVRMSITASSKS